MLAIDSSAIVAILLDEGDSRALFDVMLARKPAIIGAPTRLEAFMVLTGRRVADASAAMDVLLAMADTTIVDFTADHLVAAADAFTRFGRGSGHPAKLNYGDCMAYAVAKVAGCPLLFKGDDFARTDIARAT